MTDSTAPMQPLSADIDDSTLLSILTHEKKQGHGFGNDTSLSNSREKALNYYKGVMTDLKPKTGRSKVVSTDVADTLEAWLPDMIEIFTGGDDIVSFKPTSDEDSEQAKIETAYLHHMFFEQCDGYQILEDAFINAGLMKIGVFHWYWDESETVEREDYATLTMDALALALQEGWEIESGEAKVDEATAEQSLSDVTLRRATPIKGVKVVSIPPEDFSAAEDTDRASRSVWCAYRQHVRAQDLLDMGYDAAKVSKLDREVDEETETARATNDEDEDAGEGAVAALRRVEIINHFIRLGDSTLRVVTGNKESVILDKTEVDGMNFSTITPFRVPSHLVGLSLADKTIEVQQTKTTLLRAKLDEIYFAQNQRQKVKEGPGTNPNTIGDLGRNEPNRPVRVNNMDDVAPLIPTPSAFDFPQAIEAIDVVSERRTGVLRGNQGLNPDTLHDTATGAAVMLNEGQKRTRRMARSFAETGVRDMFLGLHRLIRTYADQADYAEIAGDWVQIDPRRWRARTDMMVEIGVGSGGRSGEMALFREVLQLQGQARAEGSGIVTEENIFNAAVRFMERGGVKTPEAFVTKPMPPDPNAPPPPDPEMEKAKAEAQMQQAKLQGEMQRAEAKVQHDMAIAELRMQSEERIARERLASEERIAAMQTQPDRARDAQSSFRPGGDLHR